MTDIKYFTEIGIGNGHFIETETERGDVETRAKGFVPMRLVSVYLRLWIGYRVFILSWRGGFVRQRKDRKKFKLLFGIEGCPK